MSRMNQGSDGQVCNNRVSLLYNQFFSNGLVEDVAIPTCAKQNCVAEACGHVRRSKVLALLLLLILVTTSMGLWAQTGGPKVIAEIVPHGNRRIPRETIVARMFSKPGDVYDEAALDRDFNSLWNTGYFDDLRFEREESTKGWIIHVYVKEKPTIREIRYEGLSAVSQSDVLDRFKERKVGLSQESQYDPTKVKKAEVVLKELLAEHGRQFATVRTEIRPIPPASVGVSFVVKEGPKVKVGNINFEGNKHLGRRYLRASMRNLRPLGVPRSIFLENLISKTYDATKLNEDTERVRDAFQQKGYFKAQVRDARTKMRDTQSWFHMPFTKKSGPGKAVDITLPVEEGEKYRLAKITFAGNKAVANTSLLRAQFAMKDGELFNTAMVRKGLENLRKVYGEGGYINFTPVPDTKIDDQKHLITLNIDLDEGKPFFVRRIEFQGNTTTRDRVIRRELAVEEGQVYNTRMWDMSLLRLNQLNYFEALKPEDATDRKLNEQDGTVDLTLKVKEKGKNSIGVSGGVSGSEGPFVGLNYSTNNLFGLGETLSVGANIGNLQRSLQLGFTEPYAFNRPLQLGFTVFFSKYNYNEAKQYSVAYNQSLNLSQGQLNLLQNFTQSSTGFTVSATYPMRRSFKRLGITYSFDNTSIQTFSTASEQYFSLLSFRSISGPNALSGIRTSKIVPNFSSNTIDYPMRPHKGQSFYMAAELAGIGGNVRSIRPILEYKRFQPMKILKPLSQKDAGNGKQTLGVRLQSSFITGYGGLSAPPFQRFFMGGDTDLRGFDTRSITPYTFITTTSNVNLLTPSNAQVLVDPGNPQRGYVTVPLAVQQLVFTGGDASMVANIEYRIPIAGPVSLAIFNDFGYDVVLRNSQLRLSQTQISTLNQTPFFCPTQQLPLNSCNSVFLGSLGRTISSQLNVVPGTNWQPRDSTGLELQVMMPIINAPFRIYYAYNPLRVDRTVTTPYPFSRSLFPAGDLGTYTWIQTKNALAPTYRIREPLKTFRFTVSTTF